MIKSKDRLALAEYYEAAKKIAAQQVGADPHEPAAVRLNRIDRLKKDFEEFCWYYFPNYMTDKSGKRIRFGWFHKKAAKAIIADPDIYCALEWPRGHAKSVFADIMIPLYLKAIGELNGVIVASQNEKKAINLLVDIQVQLESNARYIADFGEQVSYGDWSEGSFSTQDGIGFWAFGRGQSPRGARKGEKRPDFIVCDDIDDKEIIKNQERTKEAVDWVREDLMGCFDGTRGRFVLAGNRINRKSILAHLIGDVEEGDIVNPIITHIKVFALEDPKTHQEDQSADGVPAWKERFTRAKLEKQFAKIGYTSSQREYFHKHIEVGRIFNNDMILFAPMPDYRVYSQIVTYCDPSFKDTKKSDFKGIVALGKLGRYYDVLDIWLRQATTGAMVKAHYDMAERLEEGGAKLVTHFMESNFLQDLILDDYVTESESRNYMLPIRGDDRSKPDKFGRIEGMTALYERMVIRYNEALKNKVDFRTFKDQLIGFPAAHDDGPDAQEGAIWQINKRTRIEVAPEMGAPRRDNRY